MADNPKTKLTSPVGRVSYPSVFKPAEYDGGKQVYECSLLIDKGEDITILKQAMADAVQQKWGEKPAKLEIGLKDGDVETTNQGEAKAPGCWIVKFSSQNPPGLVDAGRQPIFENSGTFYAGCYARVTFDCYAWEYGQFKKGVSFGLRNIQKVKDGEPFGAARVAAEDDFDDYTDGDIAAVASANTVDAMF